MTVETRATARRMWGRLEAIHTLHYFATAPRDAHAALGLVDRTVAYVASRSAPMGRVAPEVVTASFYGFSPRLIRDSLSAAWAATSPEQVLSASLSAMGRLLQELLTGLEDETERATGALEEVARRHPIAGRPLAAAWSAVPWHEEVTVRLWQAATIVRESRGDGHLACLVDAQLDEVECHLMVRGDNEKVRTILGAARGHTESDWDAAAARLVARGLLTAEGAMTEDGLRLRDHVEARTDTLASPPWDGCGQEQLEELQAALGPLVERIVASGILPGIVVRNVEPVSARASTRSPR